MATYNPKNWISRRGLLTEIHKIVEWSKIFTTFLICKLTTNSVVFCILVCILSSLEIHRVDIGP